MPTARFTQAEISRLIRGARAEGIEVEGLALVIDDAGQTRVETVGKRLEDTNRKSPHDGGPGDWD